MLSGWGWVVIAIGTQNILLMVYLWRLRKRIKQKRTSEGMFAVPDSEDIDLDEMSEWFKESRSSSQELSSSSSSASSSSDTSNADDLGPSVTLFSPDRVT